MDQFTKDELKGRRIFEKFLNNRGIYNTQEKKKYQFSKDKFCPIDGVMYKGEGKHIFEIKRRSQLYSTLYMEYSKFKSMMQIYKKNNSVKDGWYINLIDGKMYAFRLSEIAKYVKNTPFAVKQAYCKRTTSEDRGRTDKLMIDLPISLAKVYDLDYWE